MYKYSLASFWTVFVLHLGKKGIMLVPPLKLAFLLMNEYLLSITNYISICIIPWRDKFINDSYLMVLISLKNYYELIQNMQTDTKVVKFWYYSIFCNIFCNSIFCNTSTITSIQENYSMKFN